MVQEMKDRRNFEKSRDETSSCCTISLLLFDQSIPTVSSPESMSYTNTNHSVKMLAQHSM